MQTVLSVFGTRPEAIKMAPVVSALSHHPSFHSRVCVTGQHREMLDQMLDFFSIDQDYDLDLMQPDQTLADLTAKTLQKLSPVLQAIKPDWVLVQGDTTTAMATSLAAFYQKIPVAHVEAGLRTHDLMRPYPEELNRQIISRLAALHFAPTEGSAQHLRDERVPLERIHVVGNTVIDALLTVVRQFEEDIQLAARMRAVLPTVNWRKRLVLVTGHRRENWDGGLARICQALRVLADSHEDIQIVYPVHLNPHVQKPVYDLLKSHERITLIDPLSYLPFVYLLSQCHLVITDSGGIQEEAPSLGKPLLVTRDTTERPEGMAAGSALLVGTETTRIIEAAHRLLNEESAYQSMSQVANPYGDGKASQRIVDALRAFSTKPQRHEASLTV